MPRFDSREKMMGRKFIDCRDFPSDVPCSVAISADSEEELMQIAVEHAVSVHHHSDSPALRQQLQQMFKDEADAGASSAHAHGGRTKPFGSLMHYLENVKNSAMQSRKRH
jgi:predicted small metal-binding protein